MRGYGGRFGKLTRAEVARMRRGARMRGLGDLPDDLAMEQVARPPILNAKEFTLDDQRKADLEAVLPRWHRQKLSNFVVQIGLISSKVLSYDPNRAYCIFINDSANVIRLGFDRDADLISGIPLVAGGGFFEPVLGHIGDVYALTTVASQNLLVCEGKYV